MPFEYGEMHGMLIKSKLPIVAYRNKRYITGWFIFIAICPIAIFMLIIGISLLSAASLSIKMYAVSLIVSAFAVPISFICNLLMNPHIKVTIMQESVNVVFLNFFGKESRKSKTHLLSDFDYLASSQIRNRYDIPKLGFHHKNGKDHVIFDLPDTTTDLRINLFQIGYTLNVEVKENVDIDMW